MRNRTYNCIVRCPPPAAPRRVAPRGPTLLRIGRAVPTGRPCAALPRSRLFVSGARDRYTLACIQYGVRQHDTMARKQWNRADAGSHAAQSLEAVFLLASKPKMVA